MKTTYAASLLPLLLLGSLLSACSASSNTATGGRPELPTDSEVRHPAAPKGSPVFLSLLTDADESLYQTSVTADSVTTKIDPLALGDKYQGRIVPISGALPEDAVDVKVSDSAAKVLLHWVMWQDKNSNGLLDDDESLPLLTHDQVVYADRAVNVTFQTLTPDMLQSWNFAPGWSRAEHFVYQPKDIQTYQRSLTTNGLNRFELHQPMPITSM